MECLWFNSKTLPKSLGQLTSHKTTSTLKKQISSEILITPIKELARHKRSAHLSHSTRSTHRFWTKLESEPNQRIWVSWTPIFCPVSLVNLSKFQGQIRHQELTALSTRDWPILSITGLPQLNVTENKSDQSNSSIQRSTSRMKKSGKCSHSFELQLL